MIKEPVWSLLHMRNLLNTQIIPLWCAVALAINAGCVPQHTSAIQPATETLVQDVDWHMDQGIDAYAVGDFDTAIFMWEAAVRLKPRSARLHNFLGLAYMNRSDNGRAMIEFETATQLDPGLAEAFNNYGYVLFKQRAYEDALEAYQHALAIDPAYDSARQNFKLALRATAGNLDGWAYTLAEEGIRAQDLEQKIALYKRALEVDSTYAEVFNNLGAAHYYSGDVNQALSSFRKAVNLDPGLAESYNNLGYVYIDLGLYNDAIDQINNALEIDPFYVDAYNNLARAFVKYGEINNAIIAWRSTLRIQPNNRVARRNLQQYQTP